MIFSFLFLLWAPMMVHGWPKICDTCQTVTKVEKVTNRLNPLLEPLEKYLQEHQLENEHTALKNVLLELGVEVEVAEALPLQAFVLQHQKKTSEEIIERNKINLQENIDQLDEKNKQMEARIKSNIREEIDQLKLWIKPPITNSPTTESAPTTEPRRYFDCLDHLRNGAKKSGVYTIHPQGLEVEVFCDMETDGGGWTVFLQRQKQTTQEDFRRNWLAYRNGFGTPPGEYWMGNEALHLMTSSKNYSMRTEATSPEGSPTDLWSEFNHFKVDSEAQKYRLTLAGRNNESTTHASSNLNYNNGQDFTAIDKDNDNDADRNCAERQNRGDGGGFWYDFCSYIYPTCPYGKIYFWKWSTADDKKRIVSKMEMKMRPMM